MVGLVQFVPPELSFWMDPKYPGYTQVHCPPPFFLLLLMLIQFDLWTRFRIPYVFGIRIRAELKLFCFQGLNRFPLTSAVALQLCMEA